MQILVLSAYDAKSHQYWRERLVELFPNDEWTQLTLAARNFSWRIRGNSLIWALNESEILNKPFDLIIATSMVDLSALRGFVPSLCSIPTLLYFHENQFAYPSNEGRSENVEHLLVPIYSAYCADEIAFNSNYNKSTFLEGAKSLLSKLPEKFPPVLTDKLENSRVLPVPLANNNQQTLKTQNKQLELVWNHRWEYDKGPELLLETVKAICFLKLPIRLHIVGEKFRQVPAEFKLINQLLDEHSQVTQIERGEFGRVEKESLYYKLLARCDVVLSTALHDFQGLAIQEGCLYGCTPLTPYDLAYKDYLPEALCYRREESNELTVNNITQLLRHYCEDFAQSKSLPKVDLTNLKGSNVLKEYQEAIEVTTSKRKEVPEDN